MMVGTKGLPRNAGPADRASGDKVKSQVERAGERGGMAGQAAAWQSDRFQALIDLGPDATRVAVGDAMAAIISGDGTVNDEGWIEVFGNGQDHLAFLHAGGRPYDRVLHAGLAYPACHDTDGGQGSDASLLALHASRGRLVWTSRSRCPGFPGPGGKHRAKHRAKSSDRPAGYCSREGQNSAAGWRLGSRS
jgi:hypothetical protein